MGDRDKRFRPRIILLTLYLGIGFTLKLESHKGRDEMSLKIGELAERGGVNLQTIRYYEREGLLLKPPRLSSGYRVFPDDTVRRVRFVKRGQELGFSLKEIRELLSIRVDPERECGEVRELAQAKLKDIEGKIATLKSMKKVLSQLAKACPGSEPSAECPILEGLNGVQQ